MPPERGSNIFGIALCCSRRALSVPRYISRLCLIFRSDCPFGLAAEMALHGGRRRCNENP